MRLYFPLLICNLRIMAASRLVRGGVPASPKLTTRADRTLTSVYRVPAVVNRGSAPPAETD